MKKLRWFGLVTSVALVLIVCLSGCGPSEKMLAAFDDDAVIGKNTESYYMMNSTQSNIGNQYKYTLGKFSGVKKLKTVSVEDNPIITLKLNIEGGDFKLVLVGEDKIIHIISDKNCDAVIRVTLSAGKYDIKMVGKYAAKVNFTLCLDFTY